MPNKTTGDCIAADFSANKRHLSDAEQRSLAAMIDSDVLGRPHDNAISRFTEIIQAAARGIEGVQSGDVQGWRRAEQENVLIQAIAAELTATLFRGKLDASDREHAADTALTAGEPAVTALRARVNGSDWMLDGQTPNRLAAKAGIGANVDREG